MTVRLLSLCSVFAFLVLGCKSSTAPSPSSTARSPEVSSSALPPAAKPADPATAGTLTGTVDLKGAAPKPVKIDMSMDPACAMAPGENMSQQYVVDHSGGLENVFVYLKRGTAGTSLPASSAPAGTPTVTMDQRGCKFVPHVVAVQQGGSVSFSNSDPTMHNVHTTPAVAGNAGVDVSEAPGGPPQVRQFTHPETMLPVRCNNHPWMNGFVNIAANPFFAVTGKGGAFRIEGVPPGKYILAAVHEKLGEQDIEVDVPPHGTVKSQLIFTAQ